jgi:excisionase family DNA binding protein
MRTDMISVAEAAEALGISGSRIRALIREGRIKAQRVGIRSWVLRRKDIESFERGRPGRPPKVPPQGG